MSAVAARARRYASRSSAREGPTRERAAGFPVATRSVPGVADRAPIGARRPQRIPSPQRIPPRSRALVPLSRSTGTRTVAPERRPRSRASLAISRSTGTPAVAPKRCALADARAATSPYGDGGALRWALDGHVAARHHLDGHAVGGRRDAPDEHQRGARARGERHARGAEATTRARRGARGAQATVRLFHAVVRAPSVELCRDATPVFTGAVAYGAWAAGAAGAYATTAPGTVTLAVRAAGATPCTGRRLGAARVPLAAGARTTLVLVGRISSAADRVPVEVVACRDMPVEGPSQCATVAVR